MSLLLLHQRAREHLTSNICTIGIKQQLSVDFPCPVLIDTTNSLNNDKKIKEATSINVISLSLFPFESKIHMRICYTLKGFYNVNCYNLANE